MKLQNETSLFTQSQVVSDMYEYISSTEQKNEIFWRMLVTKQLILTWLWTV